MNYGDDASDIIPEGLYKTKLTNATLDETGDVPVLTLAYIISDGEHEGKALWQRFRFNDKSKKFLCWQLGILHVWKQLSDSPSDQEAARRAADLMFAKVDKLSVTLEISHREWEGKTYENVIIDEIISDESDIPNKVPLPINTEPTFDSKEDIPF